MSKRNKIEKAKERFDSIVNKIFIVNIEHQAFTDNQWNEEVAPLFRQLKKLISHPFEE